MPSATTMSSAVLHILRLIDAPDTARTSLQSQGIATVDDLQQVESGLRDVRISMALRTRLARCLRGEFGCARVAELAPVLTAAATTAGHVPPQALEANGIVTEAGALSGAPDLLPAPHELAALGDGSSNTTCAVLLRTSSLPCVRGVSFGCNAARSLLWVSHGCRGRFVCSMDAHGLATGTPCGQPHLSGGETCRCVTTPRVAMESRMMEPEIPPAPEAAVSCARVGERATFRSLCGETTHQMSEHLEQTRSRRGLTIEYAGESKYGWGHALSAAYGYHALCRALRRFCMLRLYDLDLDVYFGYATGESWSVVQPLASLEAAYSNDTIVISIEAPTSLPALMHRLVNVTTSLIRVVSTSSFLLEDDQRTGGTWMPNSLHRPNGLPEAANMLDRCFCRFVSEPRFELPVAVVAAVAPESSPSRAVALLHAPALRDTYHLRTGAADIPQAAIDAEFRRRGGNGTSAGAPGHGTRQHDPVSSWGEGSGRTVDWLERACVTTGFVRSGSGAHTSFIMSDSPRLLSHLRRHGPSRAAVGIYGADSWIAGTPTRSWHAGDATKLATAVDVVLAGLATRAYSTPHSSFLKPVVARSVCIRDEASVTVGPCPNFTAIFVRDLHKYLDGGRRSSLYSDLQRRFPEDHPCKVASREACTRLFVQAVV